VNKFFGIAIIALGIALEVMWLGVCFGTLIIGILLLIFAPRILFFPFNFFLVIGLTLIAGKDFKEARYRQYQQSSSSNSYSSYTTASYSSLEHYYKELESTSSDDMATIKKNYRRLIKEYHYDSIASKDLPEEMVKFAKEKTQKLNEAYSAIKEARK
jgi:hypothetical protein